MHLLFVLMRGEISIITEAVSNYECTRFTPTPVPQELTTLDTANGPGPDQLHSSMLQIYSLENAKVPQD